MNEQEITAGFLNRDEQALNEASKKYKNYALKIAGNILSSPEDCEECFMDALLAAWNSIPPHQPENFKTYLGKLTREASISLFRKAEAVKRISPDQLSPLEELAEIAGHDTVEDAVMEKELSGHISSFLRSVSHRDRFIFIRRYWYYDPVKDIAEASGLKESNVKMILKRLRDRLKKYLIKEGYEL